MNCSRCAQNLDPRFVLVEIRQSPTAHTAWNLCSQCQLGLHTWFTVRQKEFPKVEPTRDAESFHDLEQQLQRLRALTRVNAELLHACRQALDASTPYPQLRDTLRTAIINALAD